MSFASQVSECNSELRGLAEVPGTPLTMSDELAIVDGAPLAAFSDCGPAAAPRTGLRRTAVLARTPAICR